ncbi:uncharacterized protein LOC122795045 [Protopterus annectens]|uniref:uncharacterized protein LOC122795045 n=1 Tax=Protopterus annectens TaxID=7888 RepID=UPI001CFA3B59|nr:uncharacterized protein LOC122795045 [Protopterus annectens]
MLFLIRLRPPCLFHNVCSKGTGLVSMMPTSYLLIQRAVQCSLVFFTCIFGILGDVYLQVPQECIMGYEEESILLSVSYNLSKPVKFLQIKWEFLPEMSVVLMHTIRQSTAVNGSSEKFSNKSFTSAQYRNRVSVCIQNGSLQIEALHKNDSGAYRITVKDSQSSVTNILNLTVLPHCCKSISFNPLKNAASYEFYLLTTCFPLYENHLYR